MKTLQNYITEKILINKNSKIGYIYYPKTKDELKDIINQRIKSEGNECDLNDIDTSNITDMSWLFEHSEFNGDISKWDVSNVTSMEYMFFECESFNQPLTNWNVSKVTNMKFMFYGCKSFNQDISNWNVSNVNYNHEIFKKCPIEEKYKPKFKK